jgi:hypothetical protein
MWNFLAKGDSSNCSNVSPLGHPPNEQSVNFELSHSKVKLLLLQHESEPNLSMNCQDNVPRRTTTDLIGVARACKSLLFLDAWCFLQYHHRIGYIELHHISILSGPISKLSQIAIPKITHLPHLFTCSRISFLFCTIDMMLLFEFSLKHKDW